MSVAVLNVAENMIMDLWPWDLQLKAVRNVLLQNGLRDHDAKPGAKNISGENLSGPVCGKIKEEEKGLKEYRLCWTSSGATKCLRRAWGFPRQLWIHPRPRMAASKNPGTSSSSTILDSCVPFVTLGSLAYANWCKLLSGEVKPIYTRSWPS